MTFVVTITMIPDPGRAFEQMSTLTTKVTALEQDMQRAGLPVSVEYRTLPSSEPGSTAEPGSMVEPG